ncbi:MAG: fibronectin type III domain-containing protein [Bacteroidales bacterium]|jgi:hypothetical protein|nr:fibronectin type III domain-containing protein [Bacteroidales bacterium]
MKRLLTLLVLVTGLTAAGWTQSVPLSYYSCTSSQGTFTPLTGATVITKFQGLTGTAYQDKIAVQADSLVASGDVNFIDCFDIGFDFQFAGNTYNKFIIVSNGFIKLGRDSVNLTMAATNAMSPISIGALLVNNNGYSAEFYGKANTLVSCKKDGVSPNRTLTVEYLNISANSDGSDGVSWQIILHETSNQVQMVFGTMYVNSTSNIRMKVGLMLSDDAGNWNYRRPKNGNDWTETILAGGTGGSSNMGIVSSSSATFPSGTTYTWDIPAQCAAPVGNSNPLTLEAVTDKIRGSRTLPTGVADGYMSVMTDTDRDVSINISDYNGYTFPDGLFDTTNKRYRIVMTGTATNFNVEYLAPATKYYFRTYAYNNVCLGGPVYNPVYILDSVTTTSGSPGMSVKSVGTDNVVFHLTPNVTNDTVVILATDRLISMYGPSSNEYNEGDFVGSNNDTWSRALSGNLKVGDTFVNPNCYTNNYPNGCPFSIVIYKGVVPAGGADIVFDATTNNPNGFEITPAKVFHFGAWSKGATYSTTYAAQSILTTPTMPYMADVMGARYNTPLGWTSSRHTPYANSSDDFAINGNPKCFEITIYKNEKYGEATLESPYVKTSEKVDARFRFRIAFSGYYKGSWVDADSMIVSWTENGTDWVEAYVMTKLTAPLGTTELVVPLIGSRNKQIKVKVEIKLTNITGSGNLIFTIPSDGLFFEDIPTCDVVGNITADAVGDEATLVWDGRDANTFDVRYAVSGTNDWTQIRVNEAKAVLAGLPLSNILMAVEVRSVCGLGGDVSPWIPATFNTGYALPFSDNFDTLKLLQGTLGMSSQRLYPGKWTEYSSVYEDLADSGKARLTYVPYAASGNGFVYQRVYTWKGPYNSYQANNGQNQAITWAYQATGVRMNWLVSPAFNFTPNTVLSFDAAVRGQLGTTAVSYVPEKTKIYVAYIPDGEDSVLRENLLLDLDSLDVMNWVNNSNDSMHYNLSLSAIPNIGKGRLAIQMVTNSMGQDYTVFYLDNVTIDASCLPASGLTVNATSAASVDLSWNAKAGVSEYYVSIDRDGTPINTVTAATNICSYVPVGAGRYTFSVGYECSGDTVWSASVSTSIFDGTCAEVTDVVMTELYKTSATIGWEGNVYAYRVQVRVLDVQDSTWSAWETLLVNTNEIVLKPLIAGKNYNYRIQSVCGDGSADTSAYTTIYEFSTPEITCFAPEEIAVSVSGYYTTTIAWTNNGAVSYQYGVRFGTSGNWTVYSVADTVAALTGLNANSTYQIRVRSACLDGDTSVWGEPFTFATVAVPACPLPSNLRVEDITENSAKILWAAPEDHVDFIATYKAVSAEAWDTATALLGGGGSTQRNLNGLVENTAYQWRVRNLCDNDRISNWANADNFTTAEISAIEDLKGKSSFSIYANNGQINILNPSNLYIERVVITSTIGVSLQNYAIRSTDNVLIPTTLKNKVVVVSIYGKNGSVQSEKVLLK